MSYCILTVLLRDYQLLLEMPELAFSFVISQVARFVAIGFDILSFQFKERKQIFLCFIIAASLISGHYFLLGRVAAGLIVLISVFRFITCYFTTNKKYMLLFIALNTISLFFTYKDLADLLFYTGLVIFIVGNFQENDKLMRQLMILGISLIVVYNVIIFSPIGMVGESIFLVSGLVGYYRYYLRKNSQAMESTQ